MSQWHGHEQVIQERGRKPASRTIVSILPGGEEDVWVRGMQGEGDSGDRGRGKFITGLSLRRGQGEGKIRSSLDSS